MREWENEMRRMRLHGQPVPSAGSRGSVSSQKWVLSRTRQHDDDTCGSKIRSWGPDLSRCQLKDLRINASVGSRGNRRHSSSISRGAKERP